MKFLTGKNVLCVLRYHKYRRSRQLLASSVPARDANMWLFSFRNNSICILLLLGRQHITPIRGIRDSYMGLFCILSWCSCTNLLGACVIFFVVATVFEKKKMKQLSPHADSHCLRPMIEIEFLFDARNGTKWGQFPCCSVARHWMYTLDVHRCWLIECEQASKVCFICILLESSTRVN